MPWKVHDIRETTRTSLAETEKTWMERVKGVWEPPILLRSVYMPFSRRYSVPQIPEEH